MDKRLTIGGMDDVVFNRIAKALADPQRLALLEQVAAAGEGEVACKSLVAGATVTPATISHHLKELSNAGLVASRKEGQCMYLRAERGVLEAYVREVQRRLMPARGRGRG